MAESSIAAHGDPTKFRRLTAIDLIAKIVADTLDADVEIATSVCAPFIKLAIGMESKIAT